MKIESILSLARGARYNESTKAAFKSAALAYLRRIAKDLQLPKQSYSIRFNPGGIAVSGDAMLHSDSFYITIGASGVMYRTVKSQKDCGGGPNRWLSGPYSERITMDHDVFLAELRSMIPVIPLDSSPAV